MLLGSCTGYIIQDFHEGRQCCKTKITMMTQKNTEPKNVPDFNYIKTVSSFAVFDCRVE